MPVMVLYKEKSIPNAVAADISTTTAAITHDLLDAKIEVRVIEPVYAYNANEIHLEMRFRDFGEWTDEKLADYHEEIMSNLGEVLRSHHIKCTYSFYIIPSTPPRSMWAQGTTK